VENQQLEHLKLIQSVVTRMAGNQFLLKGWTVTVVAGLVAFAKAGNDRSFAWIAVGVVIVFALLDAFYLALERAYRDLYVAVAKGDTSVEAWVLDATDVGPRDVLRQIHRFAIWPLHGAALVGSLAVAVL
jgi:hypothetical protein